MTPYYSASNGEGTLVQFEVLGVSTAALGCFVLALSWPMRRFTSPTAAPTAGARISSPKVRGDFPSHVGPGGPAGPSTAARSQVNGFLLSAWRQESAPGQPEAVGGSQPCSGLSLTS